VKLEDLQKHWNLFGQAHPMGAILTDNGLAVPWDRQWDAKAFFRLT